MRREHRLGPAGHGGQKVRVDRQRPLLLSGRGGAGYKLVVP